MIAQNIPLLVYSVIWIALAWFAILPILSRPIARIKREFALALMVIGTVSLVVEWFTRLDMHVVTIISFGAFLLISGVIIYLLHRLDYYVEEILQELFVLAMSSAGIGLVTSIWYWGIDRFMGLLMLRILVVIIPLLIFGLSWLVARQQFSLWSAGIFVVLLIIKWITLPLWGVWTIVLLMLYSTLVGYVANWMATTTYAEKILSWNVSPAKIWSLLVLSAGMLVLFF